MKVVSNPAEYKPCWFSYQGSVQGVLNSLGVDFSLSDVIAVSGYWWLTNAMKKNLTEEEMDENSYHGTTYTMACLTEVKSAVSEYLIQNDSNVEPSCRRC